MGATATRTAVVRNAHGLHARPCHAVVSAARELEAEVELECAGRVADARSILAVMTLGAAQGATVTVRARGEGAEDAAERVAALIEAPEPPH